METLQLTLVLACVAFVSLMLGRWLEGKRPHSKHTIVCCWCNATLEVVESKSYTTTTKIEPRQLTAAAKLVKGGNWEKLP